MINNRSSSLLFLFERRAERYLVCGLELVRYRIDFHPDDERFTHHVMLELADLDDNIGIVTIKCADSRSAGIVCDRICESCLNHPGIIDLRGLGLSPDNIEEE